MADDDAAVLQMLEIRVPADRATIREWAKGELDNASLLVVPRFIVQAAQRWVEDHDA